jgi:hypothetical protein
MSTVASRQHSATPVPAPAARERASLRLTLLDLLRASPADAGAAAESQESRERLAHTAERRVWRAHDVARWVLARDVGAYARALRAAGVPPRQALAAVVAAVREAAESALVTGAPLDDLVHDAGRHCVAARSAR